MVGSEADKVTSKASTKTRESIEDGLRWPEAVMVSVWVVSARPLAVKRTARTCSAGA